MQSSKDEAKEFFLDGEYKKASFNYSLVLNENPEDTEAKVGLTLCDLAEENELEAIELFELYQNARVESMDSTIDMIDSFFSDGEFGFDISMEEVDDMKENFIEYEDGIEYKDFKNFIYDREDFIQALEDLMFSTKLIIQRKEDFVEFITLLLDNGYKNSALNYLESAMRLYPYESFFVESISKIEG